MPRFMVSWEANPSAWPTDPKQILAILEGATSGGDQLLKAGAAKELGWFTPQKGYGIFEADSKARVLGMVQGFFPYYTQDVREIVPWESAKQAFLDSARQAATG
jgi:hypothetical protein